MGRKPIKDDLLLGKPLSVRLEPEQEMKLKFLSVVYNKSRNAVLRDALDAYWKKHERRLLDANIDLTEAQDEFRKIIRRVLEKPLFK